MGGKSNKQYQLWGGRFFSMNDPERIELHFNLACCLSKIIAAFTTPAGKGLNR